MFALTSVNSFYDRRHILHVTRPQVKGHEILAALNGTGKATSLKTSMVRPAV